MRFPGFGFALVVAAALAAGPAFAGETAPAALGESPAWAIGFRLGNERQQGAVDDAYASQLTPGPVGSLYLERTLESHLRLGAAFGAGDSTVGATNAERDYTRLFYEAYLRTVAFPGHITPYALGSAGIYHGFAGSYFDSVLPLDEKQGKFTWSVGGGFDLPVKDDFTLGFEARFRSFAREGANAKTIEIMIAPHLWVR